MKRYETLVMALDRRFSSLSVSGVRFWERTDSKLVSVGIELSWRQIEASGAMLYEA